MSDTIGKVYCCSCKHYVNNFGDIYIDKPEEQCHHPNNLEERSNPIRKFKVCLEQCHKLNKDNDCKWFDKKNFILFFKKNI